jgi:prophage antirepressor-like protein
MSNITPHIFNTITVRSLERDGQIWFVATDVCKALEISNTPHALKRLDDDEKATIANSDSRHGQGAQNYNIINESGLYSLVLRSRKPEAKQFKKWVTSEVLPSIRKTGGYSLTLTTEQQYQIKEAVNQNAGRTGRTFQTVYRDLYQQFQVPRYQDILAKDFDKAIEYLGYPAKQHQKAPALPHIAEDGRWLVIVRNNIVTHVRNINDYNCINADVFKKLRMQTKQQAEYLLELATRMRVIDGECSNSRLDVPIEESHPKFII